MAMAKRCALINKRTTALLRRYWPETSRPKTVILQAKSGLSSGVAASDGSISLRLPKSVCLNSIF